MESAFIGGICVALVAFGFAKHVSYVVKHVWGMRQAFNQPTRTLPSEGLVTVNGIVSSIGDETPITMTLHEHGNTGRGQIYWDQAKREVEVHPFALLVPEMGARIVVEPGDDVQLRAAARATEWDNKVLLDKLVRYRTATLNDGDRAIITGILSEQRNVERVGSEYRSTKEKVKVEYTLRPIAGQALRVDSETLLDEIRTCFSWLGWAHGLGTLALVPAYIYAVREDFSVKSSAIIILVLTIYVLSRLHLKAVDRKPWFDRPNDPGKPYRGVEDIRPPT